MYRRLFAVLFSVTLFVVVLPFAARAQEGTAEETTVQTKDAASASVEATSSVSAETGQGPSSSKTGSRESSGSTLQTQTDEGSPAASSDLNTAQKSGIPAGTPAPGTNPDNPSSPPNTITIGVERCTVPEGASITVEDGDGTEARFVDGSRGIEITGTQDEVTIEGPPGDFIGNHAVSTSDRGFDTDGDYTVVTSSGISCADSGGDGGGGGGDSNCQNRHEVANLDEFDEGDTVQFHTQGSKFEVFYDVFFDSNASDKRFRIEIRRNGNVVQSEETSVNQNDTHFFVTDGSDNYTIKATLSNAGPDPTFDITVDDCRGNNNNNNNNNNRNRHHHRHHDRNRHHHRHHDRNRFHNNRFFGRGAADRHFVSERIVEERVIRETIPNNKGRLANTGGVPLTGAAVLGLASLGLGVSILRFAVRRER